MALDEGEKQALLASSPKLLVQPIVLCKIIGCLPLLSSEYNFGFSFFWRADIKNNGFRYGVFIHESYVCHALLMFALLPVNFATLFYFHIFCGKR